MSTQHERVKWYLEGFVELVLYKEKMPDDTTMRIAAEAIEAALDGKPLIPPRGKGNTQIDYERMAKVLHAKFVECQTQDDAASKQSGAGGRAVVDPRTAREYINKKFPRCALNELHKINKAARRLRLDLYVMKTKGANKAMTKAEAERLIKSPEHAEEIRSALDSNFVSTEP